MRIWRCRIGRPIFFLCFALLLQGCGSSSGVAEFQLYSQSFNLQFEQGDTFLNTLAVAERKLGLFKAKKRGKANFSPDDAAYYVDSVDPPFTASIRDSLKAIKAYNDALVALSNGEAAAALASRINTLAGNLVAAAASTAAAVGPAKAITGGEALISKTTQALNVAGPIITAIATRAARESFREQLIATYPSMQELLKAMRDGAGAMYYVIYVSRTLGASPATQETLDKDRQLLAGWVVLIDKTLVAMGVAYEAAKTRSFESDTNGLLEASIELKGVAEQIKKARAK